MFMYLIKYINDHWEFDEECRYLDNQQILLFLFLKNKTKQNKSVTCQYNTDDDDNNINTEVCTLVQ